LNSSLTYGVGCVDASDCVPGITVSISHATVVQIAPSIERPSGTKNRRYCWSPRFSVASRTSPNAPRSPKLKKNITASGARKNTPSQNALGARLTTAPVHWFRRIRWTSCASMPDA
jgi:hypothetical protein